MNPDDFSDNDVESQVASTDVAPEPVNSEPSSQESQDSQVASTGVEAPVLSTDAVNPTGEVVSQGATTSEWWGGDDGAHAPSDDVSTFAPVSIPGVTVASANPESGPSKRGKIPKRAAAVAGSIAVLAAVAGGGKIVWDTFMHGGADSPEAAVSDMVKAIESQDPLLAASVIEPNEVRLLTDFLAKIEDVTKNVGGAEFGKPQPGVELSVSSVRTRVDEVGEGIARVELKGGAIKAEVTRDKLPEFLQDNSVISKRSVDGTADVDALSDELGGDVGVITVESGGGWYISPTLTAADLAWQFINEGRSDDGKSSLPEPDYDAYNDTSLFADGSKTPEDALFDLADAIADPDAVSVAELLPSDEAGFAMVYADTIDQIIEEEIDASYQFSLKDADIEVEDIGDGLKRLRINDGDWRAGDQDYKLNGFKFCEEGECGDNARYLFDPETPIGREIEAATTGRLSIVVREVDDGWKVDPMASIFDLAGQVAPKADSAWLRSFVGATTGSVAKVPLRTKTAVKFDKAGYAVVDFGKLNRSVPLVMRMSGPGARELQYSYNDYGRADYWFTEVRDEVFASVLSDDSYSVLCDSDTTCLAGMGGPSNQAGAVDLTIDQPQAIVGKLASVIDGKVGPSGIAIVQVDGLADLASAKMTANFSADANVFTLEGDSYLSDVGSWDATVESDSRMDYLESDTVVVVSEPGSNFQMRIDRAGAGLGPDRAPSVAGTFSPGTSTIDVELGEGRNVVEINWSDTADLDFGLYVSSIGCDVSDTSAYDNGFADLECYGAGSGQISVQNLASYPVFAEVSIENDG